MIMNKLTWIKKAFITVAVVTVLVVALIGIIFGKLVEATLIEEIGKWALMAIVLAGIMCVICFAPIFLLGSVRDEYYPKYNKKWFIAWIKNGLKMQCNE